MNEIAVATGVLDDNERAAAENRARFRAAGAYVLNLMSGPGAGKTTLLEATVDRLRGRMRLGIIAGDMQTSRDADRLARHGVPVVQVNTGGACHMDARVLAGALDRLLLDADLRVRMGMEGLRHVREHCNVECVVGQYEAAYRAVLGRSLEAAS